MLDNENNIVTVGELFAGIGGLGLGLERAGMTVKWAIENDPYAAAVYRKNFPDVEVIEQDIKKVAFSGLEPVDLICGGFPCQDISYAGKGAGIEGERSGLWSEFWRAICDVRPRLALIENVPALLNRGLNVVLSDLTSLGYDAEWDCIPASAFGAPHRRDRVFVVAYSNSDRKWGETSSDTNGRDGETLRQEERKCIGVGSEANMAVSTLKVSGQWTVEPNVGRVANGVPKRVDRLRCLGNAVVPQVAEFVGRRIMEVYNDH